MQFGAGAFTITHPHAMQNHRMPYRILVKFAAGMQYGHHHFQCTAFLFRMHGRRDTTTVVLHADELSS